MYYGMQQKMHVKIIECTINDVKIRPAFRLAATEGLRYVSDTQQAGE